MASPLIKVKVTSSGSSELSHLLRRQIPSRSRIWKNCEFIVNEQVESYDWWVVLHYSGLTKSEVAICDPDHLVYISMEPAEGAVRRAFFDQFSKLVLCDRRIQHPDIRYENGTTWWVGIDVKFQNGHQFSPFVSQDYDSFKGMHLPKKKNRISVICSSKRMFPGHKRRLAFISKLRLHPISEYIDFFGGEHNPVLDKLDVIAPYKYHLVLENSIVPDYWSEKLGDPFLGFALPVYYGCPNIDKYFPNKSLIRIDIEDFDAAVKTLTRLITEDCYESHLPMILEARNLVLDRYNIFQLMSEICSQPASHKVQCNLIPVGQFALSVPRRIIRKIYFKMHELISL